jgi:hypothetical protein
MEVWPSEESDASPPGSNIATAKSSNPLSSSCSAQFGRRSERLDPDQFARCAATFQRFVVDSVSIAEMAIAEWDQR